TSRSLTFTAVLPAETFAVAVLTGVTFGRLGVVSMLVHPILVLGWQPSDATMQKPSLRLGGPSHQRGWRTTVGALYPLPEGAGQHSDRLEAAKETQGFMFRRTRNPLSEPGGAHGLTGMASLLLSLSLV